MVDDADEGRFLGRLGQQSERREVSVVSTKGPNADFNGSNPSETVLARMADALALRHPVRLPTPS